VVAPLYNKNVTSETTGGVMASYTWTAGQDAEDRLIDWDSDTGEERDWDLSLVGDWDEFTRDEDGSGGPLLPIVQPRNHTDAHEVDDIDGVAAAHDAKGNMTNDGAVAGNARTFAWDFDNRLTTVTMPDGRVHTYTYDALGRRVSKKIDNGVMGGGPFVETVYVCATHESGLGQVVAEYLKGQPATNPERHFVYGSYVDEPLILAREATRRLTGSSELTARTRFLSSLVYYHRNRKYDIVGITGAAGAVLERYTYTPYGEVTILDPTALVVRTVSAVDNPYAYTGRRWEPETGLYYFRARYYGPKLGRFLGRDPLGYVDGSNLYCHLLANPVGHVDPTGLKAKGPCNKGEVEFRFANKTIPSAGGMELRVLGGFDDDNVDFDVEIGDIELVEPGEIAEEVADQVLKQALGKALGVKGLRNKLVRNPMVTKAGTEFFVREVQLWVQFDQIVLEVRECYCCNYTWGISNTWFSWGDCVEYKWRDWREVSLDDVGVRVGKERMGNEAAAAVANLLTADGWRTIKAKLDNTAREAAGFDLDKLANIIQRKTDWTYKP